MFIGIADYRTAWAHFKKIFKVNEISKNNTAMIEYLKRTDKLIVLSLLVKVMDADNIVDPREKEFLENIKARFELNQDDERQAQTISLEECKKKLIKFSDPQRKEIKGILLEMAWADGQYVEQEKELIESLQLDISHFELELIADWRDEKQVIVGYYSQAKEGGFCFEDIRSLGFSELTYKGGEEISIPTERIEGLEENTYYEFSWTVALDESERGFHIVPKDNSFKKVKPKELVDRLYAIWENSNLDVIKQLSDVQRMVNTQLTASSDGTFIYELLQNANDYPVIVDGKIELVDVEFHLTDRYLIYRHTGRYFSPRNIAAISKLAAGEKKKEKNAIGYKGIGFKTVFSENQYVFLESGEYTLRFDESITQESSRFPWQIMPIWTEYSEVDEEVKEVMSDEQNFRVQMAIRPDDTSKLHEAEKSYEFIFNDIFTDEKDILFIPNLRSVKVFYDGEEKIYRTKNVEKWALTKEPLKYTFKPEEIEENNQEVITNKRIPEKYKDFEDTRFSFACQREGSILIPVIKSKICCYLPTQVTLGFPFMMNTDMIPTGARDGIEKEIRFNHKLMKIAGSKLVEWLKDLLKCGEYELCSVFTIIPSFEPVKNYEDFIEEFKEGFDEALEEIELIPTEEGSYSLISDIIVDETGIASSGILSDEEFIRYANLEGTLPAKALRKDERFIEFVKKYVCDDKVFNTDSLHDMVENDDFKDWLEVQENNNRFIEFLLENDLLDDFISEDIFIGTEDGLYSASELYEDVDDYLEDLQAFESLINRLSPKTREYFKDNEKWHQTIESEFKKFDCADFVDNNLLSNSNKSDTKETLRDKETSIKFYKFLAEHVGYSSRYKELPFFDDNDEEVDDFNDKFIFLSSDEAHKVCDSEWLKSIDIVFLSNDYSDKTREYLTENFGVQEYSNNTIVKDIILSDDSHDTIVDDLDADIDISKSFVDYCFANKELFKSGELKDYPLCVIDGDGDEQWCLSEDHIYFASPLYETYAEKEWIEDDWMYQLDNAYIEESEQKDELKQFIASTFKVKELTDELFYKEVVKKHLHDIFGLTSGENDYWGEKNIDFVKYLDENYNLIFEELRDDREFKDFQPLSSTDNFLSIDGNVYIYNSELAEIMDNEWFPEDIVYLCNKAYGNSKALKAIGCKEYNFRDFYDDVIVRELNAINETVDSKDLSLEFHSFIIQHLGALTDDQKRKMVGAKVYLYGNDEPSSTSGGHKILSANAKELCDKGLVEFSDLDIIDPDYKTEGNSHYWETILGNSKFNKSSFFNWLKANQKTFADTLQDVQLNIVFWRWMKDNALEKDLESLPTLPLLLKDGSIDIDSPTIYFADEYMGGMGIESVVKNYDENALFISPLYIKEGDKIEKWKEIWTGIGLKSTVVDILTETIIPQLSTIENEDLPRLIAANREELEKIYSNNLISRLTQLKVKAYDGEFYSLNETIYIDCGKPEPFPYIELPNQISFSLSERRLIEDILQRIGGDIVSTYSEWLQRKLDCYLHMQNDDVESIRSIHYQFVNDLSIIMKNEGESIKEPEGLKKIKLLNREDYFCEARTLTMGSVYKPSFDFEACGIETDYVSDTYSEECSESVRLLFQVLKLHRFFKKEDIGLLINRQCAVYFWETYLKRKKDFSELLKYAEEGLFNNIACIPTKDEMKRPDELYFGSELTEYVDFIENKDEKVPFIVPNNTSVYDILPFKKSLDFIDALYALIPIRKSKKRVQLLKWMIEGYNVSYDDYVQTYRNNKDAKWFNNRGKPVHINKIYALEPGNKKLEQYFGTDPRIINDKYLPKGEAFRKACEILGIKIITSEDLTMDTVVEKVHNPDNTDLKVYALVIAGMIDAEKWRDLYGVYNTKLTELHLYECSSIKITYRDDDVTISNSFFDFYHQNGTNEFYFVNSLDDKLVFSLFVEEYMKYLCIDTNDIAEEVIRHIMASEKKALAIAAKKSVLMRDEDFINLLCELSPDFIPPASIPDIDDDDEEINIPEKKDGDDEDYEDDLGNEDDEDDEDEDEEGDEETGQRDGLSKENGQSLNSGHCQDGGQSQGRGQSQGGGQNQGGGQSQGGGQNQGCGQSQGGGQYHSGAYRHSGGLRGHRPRRPFPYINVDSLQPRVPTQEEIDRLKSHGTPKHFSTKEMQADEQSTLNRILGEGRSPEEIVTDNYLAQLRFWKNLQDEGFELVDISCDEFVLKGKVDQDYKLKGGKYIHRCSAAGGILYISPSIWNMITDDSCIICVFVGAKVNEFFYIRNKQDLLNWIKDDDIVIKLTGEERVKAVDMLYSEILNRTRGTAYTLIRVAYSESYNSLFAPIQDNVFGQNNMDSDEKF